MVDSVFQGLENFKDRPSYKACAEDGYQQDQRDGPGQRAAGTEGESGSTSITAPTGIVPLPFRRCPSAVFTREVRLHLAGVEDGSPRLNQVNPVAATCQEAHPRRTERQDRAGTTSAVSSSASRNALTKIGAKTRASGASISPKNSPSAAAGVFADGAAIPPARAAG